MIKKVFRLYADKDSEEKWINDMANKGWAFSHFFLGMYTFKKCEVGEYVYRIDLMGDIASGKKSMDYIKLVEETGAEYVDSWFRWVYFRKKSSENGFELYSDIDSRINNYKGIRQMFAILGISEFCIGMGQLSLLFRDGNLQIFNLILVLIIFYLGFVILSVALKTNKKIKQLMKENSIKE